MAGRTEPQLAFAAADIESGEGLELMRAMRAEIADLYDGLDLDGAAMPTAGAAELSPPDGAFVVGFHDDLAVCCGGVKRLDERRCELKRMYVVPTMRGRGVARALLHELEGRARRLGYEVARLDTGPRQPHSRSLFESEGYAPIENFNANPIAVFWGEKPL